MLERVDTVTKQSDLSENAEITTESAFYDMVVFCHLRWEFVYQRPQHLMSRMARAFRVLIIEEPVQFDKKEEYTATLTKINSHLHVLQPKVRSIEDIALIIPKYISNKRVEIGWFYSASFCPLLESLTFGMVVYDCMDELSLFKGAPQSLIHQEQLLLQHADVVFTGGKSLYDSKKKMHDNVYCFPSSVDEVHFAQAKQGTKTPVDIAQIPSPIVGYFGVIDERIDLDLLRETASRLPQVSFVMIGPLAKIDDINLPRLPNVYYLGMKSYNELPDYLRAFDIAMMPFALNDATKFISPTKTLEYMAAGKPIISTRIKDVERDYSHCIKIIEDTESFCAAILSLGVKNEHHNVDYNEILSNTSWDITAKSMKRIIKEQAK